MSNMLRNLPNHVGGLGITLVCSIMSGCVVANAYHQKQQFYPAVVYITKSNTSMGVMYLMSFSVVLMVAKLLKVLLFGTLRTVEYEQLIEKFFFAVTETCLAFTVFRDDFSPWFIALFTLLLFMKTFHWLTDFRVDYMERSPVITRLYHARIVTLLTLLMVIDSLLVKHAVHSNMTQGVSVQLVFGFEYAVLLTFAFSIVAKYVCHTIEINSVNPWENKAMYLLYMELIVSGVKCLLYLAFLVIMVYIHNFPLFIIRPMYINFKAFKKALRDNIQSRRAIHHMNTLYPDPTAEELNTGDNVCIICREEMLDTARAKKLPCGHVFHALCLRSWFQRQQTCPTCRLDILRPARPTPAPAAAPVPPPAAQRHIEMIQRMLQHNPPMAPPVAGAPPTTTANLAGVVLPPLFPGMGPLPPMPPPPVDFGSLTVAELLAMEGRERSHIEARLVMLRHTQTLVSASITQLTQYQEMANRLNLDSLLARTVAASAATATTNATATGAATATNAAGVTAVATTTATATTGASLADSTTSASTSAVASTTAIVSAANTAVADAAVNRGITTSIGAVTSTTSTTGPISSTQVTPASAATVSETAAISTAEAAIAAPAVEVEPVSADEKEKQELRQRRLARYDRPAQREE